MTAQAPTRADALPTDAAGWHRRVLRLAGPIMLSNLSTPLLGLVDTAVVGHLAHAYLLGAVAVGALIFNVLFWGFGFLRMGTTALTAQAQGAGRPEAARATLARAAFTALMLASALILAQTPIRWAAFRAIAASPEVQAYAGLYFDIRIWSAPAALANYALLGWFLGMQRPGIALAAQLVLNGVNIVLCVALVVGLGYGVGGVAFATTLAEYVALGIGLVLALRLQRTLRGRLSRADLFDAMAFRRLFTVNRDIFIRTLCLMAGFSWFAAEGARMGDVTLAANAVLLNLQTFMAYALDAFAFAAEVLVGSAVGASDPRAVRGAVRATTVWAGGIALVFCAVWIAAGPAIIGLLTDLAPVRAAARSYLPYAAALPIVSVWSFQLDGIFLGATRTAAMRNAMIASLALFVTLAWVLVPPFGNHGLWIAFLAFMAARGLTLAAAYPRLVRALPAAAR